ncbi:hypothetical protein M1145_00925 [Patescibacteria group bacterium]|nr:hypothetical protein [Patescibacteria group bacterium]
MNSKVKFIYQLFIIILVVLLILVFAYFLLYRTNNTSTYKVPIGASPYQAVFLNDGQVYFGNIQTWSPHKLVIKNVYYLSNAKKTSNGSIPNVSLVKLGGQLQGPTDMMIINSGSVLFVENLKVQSKVVKAIYTYQHKQ